MRDDHQNWLLELTAIPSAAGREGRVVAWVKAWAAARAWVTMSVDQFGNLTLARQDRASDKPIYFTAHLDHPSFVVSGVHGCDVEAEFRGGVDSSYFGGTAVLLHHEGLAPQRGRVTNSPLLTSPTGDKLATVVFDSDVTATRGDVLTWDTGPPRVVDGRLHAPGCDDLAGVAAALSAFDELYSDVAFTGDVRVLLTRAEEVGFVGAIAACKAGTIPKLARVVALENSKSYPESPIGAGPIVRVGDRTSSFDPDLTYRIGKIAESIAARDESFKWQRKLMPGGTCEASAYQAYGYTATCLCSPLGNYHNMNEATRKIDAEVISLSDHAGLIRLLVEVGKQLDDPAKSPSLRTRLDELFEKRKYLVE